MEGEMSELIRTKAKALLNNPITDEKEWIDLAKQVIQVYLEQDTELTELKEDMERTFEDLCIYINSNITGEK